MAVLNIRTAKREGARLVIGIAGVSGSGKTRTALELAYGLTNFNASKIGFIDTENKRGSLYADCLKNDKGEVQEFLIGDLEPPFSPARYAQAIKEFEAAGVEVIVIDSVTHEYEGIGGVLELREPLPGKSGKRDNHAKSEHKKFMNVMLQSAPHVICCVRAREKTRIEKQNGQTVYVQEGIKPVQEKNFMFEMTASMMMHNGGKLRQVDKSGDGTEAIFGNAGEFYDGYLTAQHGKMLRDWVDGGVQIDPRVEALRSKLKAFTEQGVAALEEKWQMLNDKQKDAVGKEYYATLLESAREYDSLSKPENDDASDLNEALA